MTGTSPFRTTRQQLADMDLSELQVLQVDVARRISGIAREIAAAAPEQAVPQELDSGDISQEGRQEAPPGSEA